jgi:hypothetical protein
MRIPALVAAVTVFACTASEKPATGDSEVTPQGIGTIYAGMTIAEANAALDNTLVIPSTLQECDYVRAKNGPDGVAFMVEQGRVSRVDVTAGTVATAEGAKIGDSEERVKSLYPSLEVRPHKYTDGHYLVVTPADANLRDYRIIFETDGGKVTRYRSGKLPAVEYVEGCS